MLVQVNFMGHKPKTRYARFRLEHSDWPAHARGPIIPLSANKPSDFYNIDDDTSKFNVTQGKCCYCARQCDLKRWFLHAQVLVVQLSLFFGIINIGEFR